MQCRRRFCCSRGGGVSLAAVATALLLVLVWQARRTQPPLGAANSTSSAPEEAPPDSHGGLSEVLDLDAIPRSEPYPYVHNQEDKCRKRSPFLVLMVTVKPEDRAARDAIRKTWGNESATPNGAGVVRIFLLGVQNGAGNQIQNILKEESGEYKDIIQQEYVDSYHNLTLKTLMGMHWVATFCPNASYVMKTDSDMFVNTEYLIRRLLEPGAPPRQEYFTGYLMKGFKPNRDNSSKWFMPPELYAADAYPNFCSGTGYVFSTDMAARIYAASLGIRRLHLEDVYVGICLAKLRVEPAAPPNDFLFNHWKVVYSSCRYSRIITSHHFHPAELLDRWKHLQRTKHGACGGTGRYRRGLRITQGP